MTRKYLKKMTKSKIFLKILLCKIDFLKILHKKSSNHNQSYVTRLTNPKTTLYPFKTKSISKKLKIIFNLNNI